jgi:integrase
MAARRRGDRWFADFMLAGKRRRQFGFLTELEAKQWEATARLALARGQPLPAGPTPANVSKTTIMDHVRYCGKVHWREAKSAAKLIRNAEQFAEWVGTDVAVGEALVSDQIAEYVSELIDLEKSGSTINRKLAAISVLARLALPLKLISEMPAMTWQQEGRGRKRWFSYEEEDAVLETLQLWGEERERKLFMFLADTGARLGEAFKLEWRDIDYDRNTVSFYETKGGSDRTLVLTNRALEAVQKPPGTNHAGPFSDINRWGLRSLWLRLRGHLPFLKDAVIHTYRHTCASRLAQQGVDLVKIKEWMGHKAIQTTLIYAHLSPKNMAEVAGVLERR